MQYRLALLVGARFHFHQDGGDLRLLLTWPIVRP
jgi:hypothetical protein